MTQERHLKSWPQYTALSKSSRNVNRCEDLLHRKVCSHQSETLKGKPLSQALWGRLGGRWGIRDLCLLFPRLLLPHVSASLGTRKPRGKVRNKCPHCYLLPTLWETHTQKQFKLLAKIILVGEVNRHNALFISHHLVIHRGQNLLKFPWL